MSEGPGIDGRVRGAGAEDAPADPLVDASVGPPAGPSVASPPMGTAGDQPAAAPDLSMEAGQLAPADRLIRLAVAVALVGTAFVFDPFGGVTVPPFATPKAFCLGVAALLAAVSLARGLHRGSPGRSRIRLSAGRSLGGAPRRRRPARSQAGALRRDQRSPPTPCRRYLTVSARVSCGSRAAKPSSRSALLESTYQ